MTFFLSLISKFGTLFLDIFNYVSDRFALRVFLNLKFTRSPWSDQHKHAKEDSGPQAWKPRLSPEGWQETGRPGHRRVHTFDHTVAFAIFSWEAVIKLFFPQEDTVKRNMWFILSFILSFFPKENQDLFCRNATYQITQYTGKSESIPIRVADIFLTFFLSWILDQPCLCVAADGRAFALQTCDGVCCTHRTFCPPARTAERAGRGCSVGPVVSGHASPAPP